MELWYRTPAEGWKRAWTVCQWSRQRLYKSGT